MALDHHLDNVANVASNVTYTASGVLIFFGFTLSDWALILGMVLGLATFLMNWYYKHKAFVLKKHIHDDILEDD